MAPTPRLLVDLTSDNESDLTASPQSSTLPWSPVVASPRHSRMTNSQARSPVTPQAEHRHRHRHRRELGQNENYNTSNPILLDDEDSSPSPPSPSVPVSTSLSSPAGSQPTTVNQQSPAIRTRASVTPKTKHSPLASTTPNHRHNHNHEDASPRVQGTGETMSTRCSLIGAVKDSIARKANAVDDIEVAKQICFDEVMYLRGGQPTELGAKWAKAGDQRRQYGGRRNRTPDETGPDDGNNDNVELRLRIAPRQKKRLPALSNEQDEDQDDIPTAEPAQAASVSAHSHIDLTEDGGESDLDADEAEDLRRAIAMSLEEEQGSLDDVADIVEAAGEGHPDSLTEGGSATRLNIQNSQGGTVMQNSRNAAGDDTGHGSSSVSRQKERSASYITPAQSESVAEAATTNAVNTFNLQALDRAQMEKERQARLKRKREETDNKTPGNGTAAGQVEKQNGKEREKEFTARTQRAKSRTVSNASISPPPVKRRTEVPPSSTSTSTSTTSTNQQVSSLPQLTQNQESAQQAVYYPSGRILQTYIAGYPSKNTISFTQLLGPKESITSCLLSSFIWDFDWLFPHFATNRTKFQLVMHAKMAAQRDALRRDFHGVGNVRLCFPPMEGLVHCMHSKLMLLFYDDDGGGGGGGDGDNATTATTAAAGMASPPPLRSSTTWSGSRCRIVVPTANLTGSDWGVGGVMENTVFLIDLPAKRGEAQSDGHSGDTVPTTSSSRHPSNNDNKNNKTNKTNDKNNNNNKGDLPFQESLTAFLRAQTVPEDVMTKLQGYDFSATKNLGFVHTIGGTHGGQSWRETGLCGLGRTVRQMGLAATYENEEREDEEGEEEEQQQQQQIQVDFVTSSMGSLNESFVTSIYLAARGDDGLKEYTRRSTTSGKAPKSTASLSSSSSSIQAMGGSITKKGRGGWRDNLRIYFPSHATVEASRGGPQCAGTICTSEKWYQNPTFPRDIIKDCISVRKGLLMHNKLLFVRFPTTVNIDDEVKVRGWTYVGSANASESAWGRLVQDRATRNPKLNCRNWECGVVVPSIVAAVDELRETPLHKDDNDDNDNEAVTAAAVALPFDPNVPIPMLYPAPGLEEQQQRPWFFSNLDRH